MFIFNKLLVLILLFFIFYFQSVNSHATVHPKGHRNISAASSIDLLKKLEPNNIAKIELQKQMYLSYFGLNSAFICQETHQRLEIFEDSIYYLNCKIKIPIGFIRNSLFETRWINPEHNMQIHLDKQSNYVLSDKNQIIIFNFKGEYLFKTSKYNKETILPALNKNVRINRIEKNKNTLNSHLPNQPIVAIIDTGIDLSNEILSKFLWSNPGEIGIDKNGNDKRFNNIDDDNNGFVDDVHGWNFADNNNLISDQHGHGTHITGIALSAKLSLRPPPNLTKFKNKLTKIQNSNPQIMILKIFSPFQKTGTISASIQAIHYANKMGANIINYSAGGMLPNIEEKNAIIESANKNIIVIAAAGNFGKDLDKKSFYPAKYNLSNIVKVSAIDENYHLLNSSGFSSEYVDVAAFGKNILSYLPKPNDNTFLPTHLNQMNFKNNMGIMSGTSQATALVTSKIIDLWNSNIKFYLLKAKLIQKTQIKTNLINKTKFASVIE